MGIIERIKKKKKKKTNTKRSEKQSRQRWRKERKRRHSKNGKCFKRGKKRFLRNYDLRERRRKVLVVFKEEVRQKTKKGESERD